MKIFLFGNSGSGKTTLAKGVAALQPFEIISIDDFRIQFGDFTWTGECKAVDRFISKISLLPSNQIIECSGMGKTGERIKSLMPRIDDKILIVGLLCDYSVCTERNSNKMWHELKMPQTKVKLIQQRMKDYNIEVLLKETYVTRHKLLLLNTSSNSDLTKNVQLINTNIQ